jgi:hypothetical protein
MPGPDHTVASTEALTVELDALAARFGLSADIEAVARMAEGCSVS